MINDPSPGKTNLLDRLGDHLSLGHIKMKENGEIIVDHHVEHHPKGDHGHVNIRYVDWRQAANLVFCAGGILVCYLLFGVAQESITKTKYGSDGEDRFTFTQALVFVQCAVNTAFAYTLRGKTRDNVPVKMYAFVAMSYLLAMMASNHALQYIPYPTQVLGKSCKPIPILVFGVLFAGKKYQWKKYVFVLMIVTGVAIFLYKDNANASQSRSMFSFGMGEFFLLFSLAMDGTTGAIQDTIRHHYKANAHSMMYHMNLFSTVYLLFGLMASGELAKFSYFVNVYPSVITNMLMLALTSALGQYFIFKTVAEFGPLTCSIVTTTRKLFTMLGSVVLFGNTLTKRQIVGTSIVFTGLLLDAIESKKKRIPVKNN
ncbi:Solute carrier family 35 member B1 [Toxocara canis]|uniref:Solute carrier family 35 member B1 n=1 Tax=Toxocara canis TaxID=6265 RepID=A0A0B2VTT0_TOXCA|nr:Solute carrier family 35 member B1 [Toxocara canis]